MPVLYVLGNLGNFLSTLIFLKKSWRKNVCVFYFLICLLFNSCYINSYMIGSIFIIGFNINAQNSNVILCKLYVYAGYFLSVPLPTILILASIDRLLISSQNVDTRLYSSKRLAYFSVSINTFVWFVFFLHVLIKVNIYEFSPGYFLCYYDLSGKYFEFLTYSSLVATTLFCLIMITLSMFTFKNVRRIRAIPRQQRKQIRSMTKKDFQMLRCLFVQHIVYIVFSIFLSIDYVYGAATSNQIQTPLGQAIDNFVLYFLTFLHDVPFCSSFFIFISVSKAFRTELKRTIYKIVGKDLMAVREEENIQENAGRDNIELNIAVVNPIVSQA